ncbi:MAG: PIN domain-containing protein [Lentisphaerota bacterium]
MSGKILLDTSAILCLVLDEEGAVTVEKALVSAKSGHDELFLSFATLTELKYIVWRQRSEADADNLMKLMRTWNLKILYPDEELCLLAAKLKKEYPLSFADSFIAAAGIKNKLVLMHKDPEYDSLHKILEMQRLPYKKTSAVLNQ